jgi:Zn-dependent peptidase ImmA (M78 family)
VVSSRPHDFPTHWRLTRGLPEIIGRELSLAAQDLRGDQRSLPILLRPICSRLNIHITRSKAVSEGKAYLEWDRSAGQAPQVLLPQNKNLTWDRFCTAHELGHYVLMTRYGWNPTGKSEYWQTEVMCDYFARQLLLPDFALRRKPARMARTAMVWCNALSRRADVPWIQVAKRITSKYAHLAFFRLAQNKDGRMKVISTSLPLEKGIGTLVSSRANFYKIASDAIDIAKRESLQESRTLHRNDFLDSKLGELFSELGVAGIFLEASPQNEQIKISVTR